MARVYGSFTPARAAALRKAQLASAAKRRKYGVGYQAGRATRQFGQRQAANFAVKRHVGSKGFSPKAKKALKYTAIGAGVGAVGLAAVAGPGFHQINKSIAYSGSYTARNGQVFTKQGGPKLAHVNVNKLGSTRKIRRVNKAAYAHTANLHSAFGSTNKRNSTRGMGYSYHQPLALGAAPKTLGTGPKGKSTVRSRRYRASGAKVGAAYRRSDRNATALKKNFNNANLRRAYYGK